MRVKGGGQSSTRLARVQDTRVSRVYACVMYVCGVYARTCRAHDHRRADELHRDGGTSFPEKKKSHPREKEGQKAKEPT